MTIRTFTFNPFQTNCYVCHAPSGEAALIDPACATAREQQALLDYVAEHGLTVRHLLLTHAHIDHIFGAAPMAEALGLPLQMHRADAPLLAHAVDQGRIFGVEVVPPPEPGGWLDEGDVVRVGDACWEVLHTPGHSPGSVCFFDRAARYVIAGDVLFSGSIGRTDLWEGSLPTLMTSIFQKLLPLGDDVRVYPGHGPSTTIGREAASNPFLTGYAELG